jgi:hypothetical protein
MNQVAEPSGSGIAATLWGVAFAALVLAALATPAKPDGVVGVVAVGHALWGIAWLGGRSARRGYEARVGRGMVVGVLSAYALVELGGMAAARAAGESGQALWFGLALSFAAAGMASAIQAGPGDEVLACQLFFHTLMALPALGAVINRGLRALAGPSAADAVSGAGPLTGTLMIVAGVSVPLLFAGLLGALARDRSRPPEQRGPAWAALLAHQAAYAILVVRWAGNGL